MHDIHWFCMSQCHLVKIFEHVVFIGHQKCNAVLNCDHLCCGTYKHVHRGAPTPQTSDSCTSRPDVSQCQVVQNPWIACQQNNASISMTQVAYKKKPLSDVRSSMHPCPGNWWQPGFRSCIIPRLPTH